MNRFTVRMHAQNIRLQEKSWKVLFDVQRKTSRYPENPGLR